jgi:hypothetical protein
MIVEVPFSQTFAHGNQDWEEHLVYEKERKNPNLTGYPYKITAISKISMCHTRNPAPLSLRSLHIGIPTKALYAVSPQIRRAERHARPLIAHPYHKHHGRPSRASVSYAPLCDYMLRRYAVYTASPIIGVASLPELPKCSTRAWHAHGPQNSTKIII